MELTYITDIESARRLLIPGTRLAFKGRVKIAGVLHAQGDPLRLLCEQCGLIYRKTVTAKYCDVLVAPGHEGNDRKLTAALSLGLPIIETTVFAQWVQEAIVQNPNSGVETADAEETSVKASPRRADRPVRRRAVGAMNEGEDSTADTSRDREAVRPQDIDGETTTLGVADKLLCAGGVLILVAVIVMIAHTSSVLTDNMGFFGFVYVVLGVVGLFLRAVKSSWEMSKQTPVPTGGEQPNSGRLEGMK